MRNAGTKKLWITSSEVIVELDGLADGDVQLVDLALPSGCWIFHIHCLPTT